MPLSRGCPWLRPSRRSRTSHAHDPMSAFRTFATRLAPALLLVAACTQPPQVSTPVPNAKAALPPAVTDSRLPRTRAERSGYAETSRYEDVVAFIDSLKRVGAPIVIGSIGMTNE